MLDKFPWCLFKVSLVLVEFSCSLIIVSVAFEIHWVPGVLA